MCGIYGYIGNPKKGTKILELFENLGITTLIRGKDATGYYGLNGSIHSAKAPVPADMFYLGRDWANVYKEVPSVLMGHNRAATTGDPDNNINNHPFINKRFGFIHNGVVSNVQVNVRTHSDCDSERIFKVFLRDYSRNNSVVNGLARTLKFFDKGNLACALVDSKDRSLYLFRNIARPIVFMHSKTLGCIIFASTKEILKTALKMTKLRLNKIYSLKVGTIMKIKEDLTITTKEVKGMRTEFPTFNYAPNFYTNPSVFELPKQKKIGKAVGSPKDEPKIETQYFRKEQQLNGSSRYQCKHCRTIYYSPDAIERHLRKVHHVFDYKNHMIQFNISRVKA